MHGVHDMIDVSKIDYSMLDRPDILMFLFHPRPESDRPQTGSDARDILIPVEKDVVLGARFHLVRKSAPNILFFHGNGEIVSDYDDMGYLYREEDINFLPVDYRGYGRSTGTPTITAMMRDCHIIFDYVKTWLGSNGYGGPVITMGRSLGSASALALAAHYGDRIDGLVVESGFASAGRLLTLLGIHSLALQTPEFYTERTSADSFGVILSEIESSVPNFDPEDWASQLRAMVGHNIYDTVPGGDDAIAAHVKADVMLTVGTWDHMVNPGPSRILAEQLGIEVLELDNPCGHLAFMCGGEAPVKAVTAFLAAE